LRVPWMRTEASKVRWTSQATRYCSSNAPIAASSARATWSSYEHTRLGSKERTPTFSTFENMQDLFELPAQLVDDDLVALRDVLLCGLAR